MESNIAEVKITDNSDEILSRMDTAMEVALEKIGLVAEGYAKRLCTVKTGRLINSITHATASYPGVGTYRDNAGNVFDDATADGTPEKNAVYIGTNVEYAPYVELGTTRTKAKPYLKPAVVNHAEKYKKIFKDSMENA